MHCKSYSHFFSKKFQHNCISLDGNFNASLTNNIVSLEQLGPDCHGKRYRHRSAYPCVAEFAYTISPYYITAFSLTKVISSYIYSITVQFILNDISWHTGQTLSNEEVISTRSKSGFQSANNKILFHKTGFALSGTPWINIGSHDRKSTKQLFQPVNCQNNLRKPYWQGNRHLNNQVLGLAVRASF